MTKNTTKTYWGDITADELVAYTNNKRNTLRRVVGRLFKRRSNDEKLQELLEKLYHKR